tara:strand:- start:88 stop:285 length:198 start_codon:yes stop_codon:yes gene_type:complete
MDASIFDIKNIHSNQTEKTVSFGKFSVISSLRVGLTIAGDGYHERKVRTPSEKVPGNTWRVRTHG